MVPASKKTFELGTILAIGGVRIRGVYIGVTCCGSTTYVGREPPAVRC
jgi:hypothetical protein